MTTEFRPAQKASEISRALDVVEQSLGSETADYLARLYDFPAHRQEWVQVAVTDGEVVGMLGLAPRAMCMGRSTWSTATLMVLATREGQAPEVSEGLAHQALAFGRAQGCVVATVLGDPATYAKLGFVPVRPSYATIVPMAKVIEANSPVVVREFASADIPRVAAFQESCTRGRPWSIVREPDWWEWQRLLWEEGVDAMESWRFFASVRDFLVAERGGEVVGYARLQVGRGEEFLLCTEVEVVEDDHEAAAELLWRMHNRAVAAERQIVHLPAPPSIPFVSQIYEVAGQHVVRPAAANMMRVLDLAEALSALADELSGRVQNSRLAGHTGRLVLGIADDQVVLGIEGGRVRVLHDAEIDEDEGVEIAPKAAAQLLSGYRSVPDLKAAGQIEGADEDISLLRVLFPVGEPFTWGADLLY